ncbi:type II toxin-antitoxin system Phd/YefM family antitoxin, partial [Roseovarius mucosus]|uniref:type II toxin-antitoxin system Phd/YefM family antitoxin n=1 Tax=Roseovarius mucosus TaxID=215743 RepID=UPI001C606AF3
MQEIQLRDAKATLSAVIDQAKQGEPSIITRHGRPEARQGLAEPGDEPLEAEAQDRVGAGEPLLDLRRAHGDEHAIRLGTRARG